MPQRSISNLQGCREAKQDTSVAPQGKPEQDPVQNRKRSEREMERGYPGEAEKLYLARQGWGLKSSAGTKTSSGCMKDKKVCLQLR